MSAVLTTVAIYVAGVLLHEAAHAVVAKILGVASGVAIVYKSGWKKYFVAGPAILTSTHPDEGLSRRRVALSLAPLGWAPIGALAAHLQFDAVSAMLGVAVVFTLLSDLPVLFLGGLRTDGDVNVWRLYDFRSPGWRPQ